MALIPIDQYKNTAPKQQTFGRLKPLVAKPARIVKSVQRPDIKQSTNYLNAVSNTDKFKQEANQANSFRGMAKNTVTGIPQAVRDIKNQPLGDTLRSAGAGVYGGGLKPFLKASTYVQPSMYQNNKGKISRELLETIGNKIAPKNQNAVQEGVRGGFKFAGAVAPYEAGAGLANVAIKSKNLAGLAGYVGGGQLAYEGENNVKDRGKQALMDSLLFGLTKVASKGLGKLKTAGEAAPYVVPSNRASNRTGLEPLPPKSFVPVSLASEGSNQVSKKIELPKAIPEVQLSSRSRQVSLSPTQEVSSYTQGIQQLPPKVNLSKKQRGFAQTVSQSSLTDPRVKKLLQDATYTPRPNDALASHASILVKTDINKATDIALKGHDNLSVATASELIKHYQNVGNFNAAANVAKEVATKLTEAGRTVQAASLYNKLTPEGLTRYAQNELGKEGLTLTGEQAQLLHQLATEANNMTGEAKVVATTKMLQKVHEFIPSKFIDQLITTWKAGLLTNPTTHIANVTGNTTMIALETAKDYPAVLLDKFASVFTGKRTKALPSGGAVRIGANDSGAYGYIPPSGCKVRVPNVLMMSCASGTDALNSVPHATVTSRPEFSVTSAGNIDIQGCLSTWYFYFAQPYSVILKNTAIVDNFSISECATAFELEEFHTGNYLNTDINNATFTSNLAGGTATKCKWGRCGARASADYVVYISFCKDITFTDCYFEGRIFRTATNSYCAYTVYSYNIKFIRPIVVGGALYIVASDNCYAEDLIYADSYHTTSSATTPPAGVTIFGTGTFDCVLKGGDWWAGIDNMHVGTAFFYTVNTTKARWYSCGTPANPINGGTVNKMLYTYNSAGNNIDVELKRIYFTNIGTMFATGVNSSSGELFENCSGNYTTHTNFESLNVLTKGLAVTAADTGFTSVYGTIFYNIFTSAIAGRVGLTFNEETATYAPYVNKTGLTGVSGFSSTGLLYLYNLNDVIEYEFPYFIKGYTAFAASNVVKGGSGTANLAVKFKIDINDGNGWSSTWEDATSANITSYTINEVDGFKLKFQITCTTAGTNYLNALYFTMVTDATAQLELYPLDTYTLSLTGLQTGTKVALVGTGTETLIELLTESGGGVSYTYPDTDVASGIDIAILAPGYLYQKIEGYALTASNASIPIVQNVDYGYDNTTSATVSFNGVTHIISCDALTTAIDVIEVYTKWVNWALTSDNLKYKNAFNELGGIIRLTLWLELLCLFIHS
ncbi:MAG: hypothetical protein AUK19_03745 [Candidatus Moranbacteria bacterium CG2_30_45_14]|nr:MAG: hypothetical protein AUK19_03745 [Candidatus Moranbacteria bacterium CG2_30_45_14]